MALQPSTDLTPEQFVELNPGLEPVGKNGWTFLPEISEEMQRMSDAIAAQSTKKIAAE